MARKATKKAIDREIEATYYRLARGRMIDVLNIERVYEAGYLAVERGEPIEPAIQAAIELWTVPA
jgi:hypothetical protein